MNILLVEDLVQLISQYSPEVYCLLRLVNHQLKEIVDEVFPIVIPARRKYLDIATEEKYLRRNLHGGWKLLDCTYFDAWIDSMDRVLEYSIEENGKAVEKFCRAYLPKGEVARNVLGLLCKLNRNMYVRELWGEDRLGLDCIADIAWMDDLELFVMVHLSMKDGLNASGILECVSNAMELNRFEITNFLWKQYSADPVIETIQFRIDQGLDLDPRVMKNREMMLELVKSDGRRLDFVDDFLKQDREIVLAAVTQFGCALDNAPVSLRSDREIVLAAVKQDVYSLHFADEKLLKDKEIVLEAVAGDGLLFQIADESLKKDRETVLEAVNVNGRAFEYADESLRADKEIVYKAVNQCPYLFLLVDESLKKDKDFFLQLVKVNGCLMDRAEAFMRKDKQIALEAVRENGWALEFLDPSLRSDKEVVLEAVKTDGSSLQFADASLRKDKQIVLEAVRENTMAIKFADESLKKDADIVSELHK